MIVGVEARTRANVPVPVARLARPVLGRHARHDTGALSGSLVAARVGVASRSGGTGTSSPRTPGPACRTRYLLAHSPPSTTTGHEAVASGPFTTLLKSTGRQAEAVAVGAARSVGRREAQGPRLRPVPAISTSPPEHDAPRRLDAWRVGGRDVMAGLDLVR